jgi:DNA-nicking Smr family endonuclease
MRRLSPEEQALWDKVVASVRPLEGSAPPPRAEARAEAPAVPRAAVKPPPPGQSLPPSPRRPTPGTTLDGSWDRRLSRGIVAPDFAVDLHGHNLATAYDILDHSLEYGRESGARVILLITGKPPADDRRPVGRGAIRAAIGDWLAASRHAAAIAAVRNAHPRHGGAGALYIVLRRPR